MKRWRSRWHRAAFWLCLALWLHLMALDVGTFRYAVSWSNAGTGRSVLAQRGAVMLMQKHERREQLGVDGLVIGRANGVTPWWVWWTNSSFATSLVIPLWMPLALVAAPTAWLCWRGRSYGPGRCARCGYNTTATPGGVCPECGPSGTNRQERSA